MAHRYLAMLLGGCMTAETIPEIAPGNDSYPLRLCAFARAISFHRSRDGDLHRDSSFAPRRGPATGAHLTPYAARLADRCVPREAPAPSRRAALRREAPPIPRRRLVNRWASPGTAASRSIAPVRAI